MVLRTAVVQAVDHRMSELNTYVDARAGTGDAY